MQEHRRLVPAPLERAPLLEIDRLSKSFRETRAVDAVSFTVPEGSLTVLLGPAGAGKTTTLRLVAGLDRPDGGRIVLRGRNMARLEPKDRDIAMIFDNLALYPDKTGFANIASPLRIQGLAREEIERRVSEMAARLRIAHVMHRLPKTMSGGERQRVALGRALVRRPRLFLLDEPLSSLDAMLRIELRAEMKRLQREFGYTFLLATPDFVEAMAVADSVVMLREGRVVQVADAQTLYDAPVDREVARFVGAPEINILPARLDGAAGRVAVAGGSMEIRADRSAALRNAVSGFDLGLRPEHVTLADPATAPIRGSLYEVELLGLKSALTVRNDEAELRLIVDTRDARGLAVGETLGLEAAGERALAFDRTTGHRLG